jgi:hypothetical protein
MSLLPRIKFMPFTLDHLRESARDLHGPAQRSLLRALRAVAKPRKVLAWDDPWWQVTEITLSDGIVQRTLKVDVAGLWTVSVAKQRKRGAKAAAVHPLGDVHLAYEATLRHVRELQVRLRGQTAQARGRLRSLTDRAEAQLAVLRLLGWPASDERKCPLQVVRLDGELIVRVQGLASTEAVFTWEALTRGEFSASELTKQILAADLKWSARTLDRRLAQVRQHFREQRAARQRGAK